MKFTFLTTTFLASTIAISATAQVGGQIGKSIKTWLHDEKIIEAVKTQNEAHKDLTQSNIDKLDTQWRTEAKADGDKPLINKVLNNDLSTFLKQVQKKHSATYTEIFVMDNKGLNVGQSNITSDYWQGDEEKWLETFAKGPDKEHVAPIEKDESTGKSQTQVSFTVTDPETGEAIGAVTVGVNVEFAL